MPPAYHATACPPQPRHRTGGRGRLTRDPAVLAQLAARGRPATVAVEVTVTYAFFHCAKVHGRGSWWEYIVLYCTV
jgi:predicted pyridoxine 5'-phosphate oxidase superfamily flavin-nucleotide-binding protein